MIPKMANAIYKYSKNGLLTAFKYKNHQRKIIKVANKKTAQILEMILLDFKKYKNNSM